ncbi:hypothetical protein D9757_009957 [Collybiopsis confluens]|uniref:FAD-binding PCMH-type domain-containing protein n=1 Tax=Collybiopsis confluens TaxID=2823264 RepID=A0A8H5H2I3_9AGAR|nr:hypothetical protein D9757_009957 [Collybiopsis confluens]
MRLRNALTTMISLAVAARQSTAHMICAQIAASIGWNSVFLPETPQYTTDILHWLGSSTEFPQCSVRPNTVEEVATVLALLGKTNTPFAVKGGGHTSNPGFSSTTGVQMSMKNFAGVDYDQNAGTVTIGASLVWDAVYGKLQPHGVTVLGGRFPSVGVSGLLLGGGYSWKANAFGLGSDSVVAWEIAFPNGTAATVTDANDPDLAFALRGGGNNFGIVTNFVMKAYPQTNVWVGRGILVVTQDNWDAVLSATETFSSTVTDPKAQIFVIFGSAGLVVTNVPVSFVTLSYDAPEQPEGIFDQFLAIDALIKDISSRSLLSLVQTGLAANYGAFTRGSWDTIPTPSYDRTFMNALVNQTVFWSDKLTSSGSILVGTAIEPFLPSILASGTTKTAAYPYTREQVYFPTLLAMYWLPTSIDQTMIAARNSSVDTLKSVLEIETQGAAPGVPYSNYAATLQTHRLYTLDVKAMNHVLTSGPYDYQKPGFLRRVLSDLLGAGLLVQENEQHRNQRKILNPAFGTAQIREMSDIFVEESLHLRDIWASQIGADDKRVRLDVQLWLSRMTLDVIGRAGFNYRFSALDSVEPDPLNKAFSTVFGTANRITLWNVLQNFLPALRVFPTKSRAAMKESQAIMGRIGRELLQESKKYLYATGEKGDSWRARDLLSLLVRSNMSQDISENQRMTDEDVLAQIPTFLTAGHETSSSATTWTLFALCQDKEIQHNCVKNF